MKKFVTRLLSCVFILVSCFLKGQQNIADEKYNSIIDSLQNLLKISNNDTITINTFNELGWQYIINRNYEQAMHYSEKAKQHAIKASYQKGMAESYSNIGNIYFSQGNYEKALNNFLKSITFKEKIGDRIGIASSFNNIGNIYFYKGNYELALDNYQKSLKIRKEIGDKKDEADSFNNIGIIYEAQGNYEKAVDNNLKSLKIKEEIGDKDGIAASYNNIGNIYFSQNNYENALANYKKSLKIRLEVGEKQGIAMSYNNIGSVYEKQKNHEKALESHMESLKISEEIKYLQGVAGSYGNIGLIYSGQGNYEKAFDNYMKSLEISEKIGDSQLMAVAYDNIGNIYTKQGKFHEALNYLNQSLKLCQKIGYKAEIKDAYFSLSNLYDKKGDYKLAYHYHKLYSDIKDTLLNEQSGKQIAEMSTKYDSEKKDKELIKKDAEISMQQIETEKQNLQRNAFIIGFIVITVLAFFIFRGYRQKQIANRLLEEKNILIENQKRLVVEKNEKITDSINYANRIQHAILPSQELIKSFLPESFIFFNPKNIVSGDFYWMHTIDKHQVLLAAVDCTGHGVPGALMSMMGYNLLEQVVKEHHIYEPAKILSELSKLVVESLKQTNTLGSSKEAMDIALYKINYQTYELEFAGAHNPLYLIRNGKLSEIKGDNRSIGISLIGLVPFSNHKIKLEKGDCLYVFSDGFADQFGGINNEKFYYQPFRQLLTQLHHLPMDEQKERLGEAISEWKGDQEQIDDMLVIGVKI